MGLFDDILGNSQSKQTQATTDNQILVEDASSILVTDVPTEPALPLDTNQTSTPPEVDAFLNMSAGDITSEMPSYTERKAMGESVATSSLISENIATENSPILVSETPEIISEQSQVSEALATPTEVTTPEVAVESPLFGDISTTNEIQEQTSLASETAEEVISANLLPDEEEKNMETEVKTENFLFGMDSSDSEEKVETATTTDSFPTSTLDFLSAGIAQLDVMEKSLQDKKQAFLNQAEEYRAEKEKFAELEKNALADSRSMDDEHDRIVAMRKYFETQQNKQTETKEVTESVKTALTGISVQNAVDKTMKPKTRTRKAVTA